MSLGDPRSLSWAWLEAPLLVPNRASPNSAWSPRAIHGMTTVSPSLCQGLGAAPRLTDTLTSPRMQQGARGGRDRGRHPLPVAVSLGMLPLHLRLDTARPLPPAVNTFINH